MVKLIIDYNGESLYILNIDNIRSVDISTKDGYRIGLTITEMIGSGNTLTWFMPLGCKGNCEHVYDRIMSLTKEVSVASRQVRERLSLGEYANYRR